MEFAANKIAITFVYGNPHVPVLRKNPGLVKDSCPTMHSQLKANQKPKLHERIFTNSARQERFA